MKHKILTLVSAISITGLVAVVAFFMIYSQKSQQQQMQSKTTPSQQISDKAPKKSEVYQQDPSGNGYNCEYSFTLAAVENPTCYSGSCTTNTDGTDNCPGNLDCQNINGSNICVNPSCTTENDCVCPSTPAPTCYSGSCTTNTDGTDNCPGNLDCQNINGSNICVNPSCTTENDCVCPSTPAPTCYSGSCTTNTDGTDNCPGNLDCQNINGSNICVNPSCTTENDCVCPTPTPAPACYNTCDTSEDCPSDLTCTQVGDYKRCVNSACTGEEDCICETPAPPSVPRLPKAGGVPPTLIFTIGGIILVGLGLLF